MFYIYHYCCCFGVRYWYIQSDDVFKVKSKYLLKFFHEIFLIPNIKFFEILNLNFTLNLPLIVNNFQPLLNTIISSTMIVSWIILIFKAGTITLHHFLAINLIVFLQIKWQLYSNTFIDCIFYSPQLFGGKMQYIINPSSENVMHTLEYASQCNKSNFT